MIRLGLIGWPVSHSLSPVIHNRALAIAGLSGEYTLFPVDPSYPEQLDELLLRIRAGEINGLNVTIPHKQLVMQKMDELTSPAKLIGAVNTIYLLDGKLVGHNTDAPGFMADLLKYLRADQLPEKAIVLGAGGSARAVISALLQKSWSVTIAARKLEQAADLVEHFKHIEHGIEISATKLDAEHLRKIIMSEIKPALIINTTPAGMYPKVDASPWPEGLSFPSGVFVYDLVYNPRQSLILKQAQIAGIPSANGLGMLIEQAALAFEIWTGSTAPREQMLNAIVEATK